MMSLVAARVLVVDNYDSFVFNIVQYLAQLGAEVDVLRNDEVIVSSFLTYDGVLLSPGPGTPEDAGVCIEMVHHCAGAGIPLFGVCLGHQAIAVAYGATVSRAPELLHGKTSQVFHPLETHSHGEDVGEGLASLPTVLDGLPNPFTATRYHSLAVERDTLPAELVVTGETDTGVVMAMRHTEYDIEGVQFHPESVLTEGGHHMLANWLVRCGDSEALARSATLAPSLPTH